MTAPEFATRPQLSEDVARYVRKRIFDGTYAAGEYVRLDQLAAELGISVTPVREALFQLRAEGLLAQTAAPRVRGAAGDAAATSPTCPNVQAHIGGELAARAAANITDDQVARARSDSGPARGRLRRDDDERAVRLNHEFHRAINVAADSPKLAQLMSQITRYAPESVFPVVAGWPEQSNDHHRRVCPRWSNATKFVPAPRCPSIWPRARSH